MSHQADIKSEWPKAWKYFEEFYNTEFENKMNPVQFWRMYDSGAFK